MDFLQNSYASLMPVQHCRETGEKILYRSVERKSFSEQWISYNRISGFHVLSHDASKTLETSFRDPGTEVMIDFETS